MSYGFILPLSLFHKLLYKISEAKPHHLLKKLFAVYSKIKPFIVSVVEAGFPLKIMYSFVSSEWFDFYAKIFIQNKTITVDSCKCYWGKCLSNFSYTSVYFASC